MTSLVELERDVERARAKLTEDLATLRAPETFSEFTDDLKAEALDAKDALLAKAKAKAQSTFQEILDDLKARAAANPTAVFAIGAGIAWRVIQRPPIATALVGVGLYSLFNTAPSRTPYMDLYDEDRDGLRLGRGGPELGEMLSQAGDMAVAAKDKVQEWSGKAGTVAQRMGSDLVDKTTSLAEDVSERFETVKDVAAEAAQTAGRVARDTSATLQRTLSNDESRDTLLLGAAGLAVAAALAIASQRRLGDHEG
jgi:hypothetical protein